MSAPHDGPEVTNELFFDDLPDQEGEGDVEGSGQITGSAVFDNWLDWQTTIKTPGDEVDTSDKYQTLILGGLILLFLGGI